MWWKIYFWIIILLIIIGNFVILGYTPLPIVDFISLIIEILSVVGLFSFVYNKKILDSQFWKILFYINVLTISLSLIEVYLLPKNYIVDQFPFLASKIPFSSGDLLFTIILYLPTYYALYQLGFKKLKSNK